MNTFIWFYLEVKQIEIHKSINILADKYSKANRFNIDNAESYNQDMYKIQGMCNYNGQYGSICI